MHQNNWFYVEECYGIITNKCRTKSGITYAKEKNAQCERSNWLPPF